MGVALNVQVVQNGQLVGQRQFDSDTNRTIKIGRLPSAQLRLDDPQASRIHAVIEFSGSEISLIDMGSTVGTAVNGTKVHKVKLNHGDQIAIGATQLVVGLGGPAQAASAPAPAASAPAPAGAPAPASPWGAPMAQTNAPAVAVQAAPQAAVPQAAMPPPQGGAQPQQPRFDPGSLGPTQLRRITKERLRSAAVESRPHPALPPEAPMTAENRVLEMRIYWGEILLGVHHYDKPKRITIGETKRTDVFLSSEGLPREEFPLIRYHGDEYVLTFTSQMEGEVEIDGQLHTLSVLRGSARVRKDDELEASYQLPLSSSARAIVHWGGATFAMRFVTPPKAVPNPFWKNLDLQYINMLLLSVFFHLAIVVTFMVYPYDTESLREDLFNEPDRFASLILEPPKETTSTKNMLEKIKKAREREQKKEETPKPEKTKVLKTNVPVEKTKRPKKTREQKQAEVKQKFTRLFSGGGGGGLGGAMLGGGGGGTLAGTLSNVIGTTGRGSATASLAGLGIRGGALTGGGVGTSRGIAGIGTAGRLGGGGMRYGSGVGIGKRKDRNLLSFSTPVVMGALPKEVIQKVINQNKNQIRYCYEVELQRNQNLAGKVGVKWIIAATGSVARVMVTESTLRNRNVERCIQAKIKTWKFPAPAGGGIVEVNYPFVFRAQG